MEEKLLERDEIDKNLNELAGWNSIENHHIRKEFQFKNFKEAISFVNKIAEIAETENHHPDIYLYNFKKVRIDIYTHSINGLSQKDFILAKKIEKTKNEMGQNT